MLATTNSAPTAVVPETDQDSTATVPDSRGLLTAIERTYDDPDLAPDLGWLDTSADRDAAELANPSPGYRTWRRLRDVVLAATMLLVLSPLLVLVAILVKLTSPGPIIYSQVRVGRNLRRGDRRRRRDPVSEDRRREDGRRARDRRRAAGGDDAYGRPFVLYKFRTMTVDAERHGARFTQTNDVRVTWIGRLLRRTRIDELPQLWNVLRGDMALIGPRPERPEFVDRLSQQIPEFPLRLHAEPGLTGLAQVVNGYDNDLPGFRRKVLFDLLYLRSQSARNDTRILWRTVRVVLTGEGAL